MSQSPVTATISKAVRGVLRKAGVGRALRVSLELGRFAFNRQYRFHRLNARTRYLEFRERFGQILQEPLYPAGAQRRALVVTKDNGGGLHIELALIKGLQLAGFEPVVLTDRTDLERYYRLAGVSRLLRWDTFREPLRHDAAEALMREVRTADELLAIEAAGVRIGRFAASITLRLLRLGRVDLSNPLFRRTVTQKLAEGLALVATSHRLLDAVKPAVATFLGNRYAGQAELLDICVSRHVDVLAWYYAHRNSALTLKRYGPGNRDDHHASVSDETWRMLLQLPWTDERRAAVRHELHDAYASGDWYSRGATTQHRAIVDADTLRQQLQLDPGKPTAVIFPHIVWDATLWWGTDLFADYEEWLVETVRAACANARVNWLIKIHPAHIIKAGRATDNEPAEVRILRAQLGPLPPHVRLIRPDTEISTASLFPLMDYCVTVRGTIGIEAACLGIRVLTAGTGRYDHRGFTLDAESRERYIQFLQTIEHLPRMTSAERTRAERYAYGAFVLRPWRMQTWSIEHGARGEQSLEVRLNARSADEIREAPDMRAFAAWASDGRQEDFIDLSEPTLAERAG